MSMHSLALATLVLTTTALAQGRTWLVDASNGPGTDFTDLPPAVAAAADGDVLVIRAGTYSEISTGKALSLLGSTGTRIVTRNWLVPAVEVTGLPANKTFAMRNLELSVASNPPVAAPFAFRNNAGRIHLESILSSHPSYSGGDVVDGCRFVSFVDFRAGGYAQLSINASTVVLARSTLAGRSANMSMMAPLTTAAAPVAFGNGELWLVDCTLQGGNGANPIGPINPLYGPAPGLRTNGGVVHVLGTSAHGVRTGFAQGAYTTPVPAIDAPGSTIEIDPAVVLASYLNAPPIQGAAAVLTHRLAALDALGGSLGGPLAVTLRSGPGDAYVFALGAPSDPLATPIGTLFLDLSAFAVIAQGIQGAGGSTTLTFTLPGDPALRGLSFAFQGANGYANDNRIVLTNPRIVTLD